MQKNSLNSILSKKTDTSNPKVVLEVDGKFYEVGELKKINMLTVSIALGEEIKTESKESKESKSSIENEDGKTDPEKLAESQMPEVPEELTPEQEEVKKELEEEINKVDEDTSSDEPDKDEKDANK